MEEKKKEKIFYQSGNTLVSESKVISGGRAIKLAEVEEASVAVSVKRVREGIIMLFVGVAILIIALATSTSIVSILGITFMVLGGISLGIAYAKPVYYLKIRTTSGTATPYHSDDRNEIEKIVAAINQAISESQGGQISAEG